MSDDVVARLRAPDGRFLVAKLQNEAADEIERLRRERDELRWRICKLVGDNRLVYADEIAREYGWLHLCDKEETP